MAVGKTPGTNTGGIKSTWATSITEYADYDKEGLGAIRRHGHATYKWIQYNKGAGSIAAVAGNIAVYVGGAAPLGHKNHQVTSDVSDGVQLGAGVLMSAIPDTNYGWIQVEGHATINTALVSGADGNALTPSTTTDGTLKVAAAATDAICAFAEDASQKEIICRFPH